MRKPFLLPLAAILCFGCSKNTSQGGLPGIEEQNAKAATSLHIQSLDVVFHHQMSETPGFTSRSYIEYTDENGMLQTLYPEPQTLSYQIRVAEDGYIIIHVDLSYRYDVVYASISTDVDIDVQNLDHVDVYRRCIRGDTPLIGTYTIPVHLLATNNQSGAVPNIFLRGDEKEGYVRPEDGCYNSN